MSWVRVADLDEFEPGILLEHDQVARAVNHRIGHADSDVQQLEPATRIGLPGYMDDSTV